MDSFWLFCIFLYFLNIFFFSLFFVFFFVFFFASFLQVYFQIFFQVFFSFFFSSFFCLSNHNFKYTLQLSSISVVTTMAAQDQGVSIHNEHL